MKPIVTCAGMKALDRNTIENHGIPSLVLMERASLALCREIRSMSEPGARILFLCGAGNNGGDGICTARILFQEGYRCELLLMGSPEHRTEETARQLEAARSYQVPETEDPVFSEYDLIVDALFGIGLGRPVGGAYAELIENVNQCGVPVIAADIPSGISGDTGRVMGVAVKARKTVTFGLCKPGLILYPGRMYAGKVITADIGIYPEKDTTFDYAVIEDADLASWVKGRRPDGHKGTFGKVLCVTGSDGMCGAAYLSAAAALCSGCGMVMIHTAEENRQSLQVLLPEAMISCTDTEEERQRLFDWCDVIIMGCGVGTSDAAFEKIRWYLDAAKKKQKPLVLDADGLNLVSMHPELQVFLGRHVILTPHIGEMSRLTGKAMQDVRENPEENAKAYAAQNSCTVVLKDACTVTTGYNGSVYLNTSGNDGMATAGSGDVLAGIIGGVLCWERAQDRTAEQDGFAAALGVFLHGLCGDAAAEKYGSHGIRASQIAQMLPEVLKRYE